MLKKGDKVVMHTCLEAENPKYEGKIWTCASDEFKANTSGNGVFLEGFSGYFYTDYLQKVNLEGIELKNIDLTGLNLTDELYKRDEEIKEFTDALLAYLYDPSEANRNHLLEEGCDNFQVLLSIYSMLGIDIPEIAEYWNSKHLEKIKSRPRKEDQSMINKENLDKRICDCEDGQTNTQTYRDYIREAEEEFGIAPAPIDEMEEEELEQYLDFMDELWNK